MPVPSSIADLSTTAASNYPAGSENRSTIDDYHRALSALVRREQAKAANVASASTVNIGAIADGSYVHITGTTTITAFDTVSAGIERVLVFDGALTLTHNATSLILQGGANITTAAGDVAVFRSEGSGNWRCVSYMKADGSSLSSGNGQCRLSKQGANLVLSPYNGNKLIINGAQQTVPSAGVSLAPTSLTPSTVYYIYAYMNSGTMTLEASTTARATDSASGMQIKSGDATRTLVGLAYCATGPAWIEDSANIGVISWFNRIPKIATSAFTTNMTTASASPVEVNSGIRANFLSWSDSAISARLNGGSYNSSTFTGYTYIGIDGASQTDTGGAIYNTNTSMVSASYTAFVTEAAYHYSTLCGFVTGGTQTWIGAANSGGQRTSNEIVVWG